MDGPTSRPAVMSAAARGSSPSQSLLRYLGPFFALTNLSIVPLSLTVVQIAFSGFGGGTRSSARAWLPVMTCVVVAIVSLVPAQALLATVCLTWSTGVFWRRFLTYWLVALGGLACFFLGIPVYFLGAAMLAWIGGDANRFYTSGFDTGHVWRSVLQMLAYSSQLPMTLLGVQLPFWGLRLFTRWRLACDGPAASTIADNSTESLTIQDLFFATAIVGVTLGLLKFGDGVIASAEGNEAEAFLFTVLIAAAIAFVISLVAGLPLALLFLSRTRLAVAWGVTLAVAGSLAVLWMVVLQALGWTGNTAEQFGIQCLILYVATCGFGTGLTLLRRAGWRLRCCKVRQPVEEYSPS